MRANYHKHCGVRQFHAVYSLGDDTIWGIYRAKKSIANTLAAIRSCRAARPDGEWIFVILDNLSARKAKKIKAWPAKHNVERCFTPTYSSWANPIACHFGPLREFVLNNSDHVNHTVLTRRIHSYLAGATRMLATRTSVGSSASVAPRRNPSREAAPLGPAGTPRRLTARRPPSQPRTPASTRSDP